MKNRRMFDDVQACRQLLFYMKNVVVSPSGMTVTPMARQIS